MVVQVTKDWSFKGYIQVSTQSQVTEVKAWRMSGTRMSSQGVTVHNEGVGGGGGGHGGLEMTLKRTSHKKESKS